MGEVSKRYARLVIVILGALAASLSPAQAGFTTWLPSPGEPDLDEILGNLYGLSNLQRVHDFGQTATDQTWFNHDAQVSVQAKYAGYNQTFGYLKGATGTDFVPIFTVTGNGYLAGMEGGFGPAESGSIFRFADDPNGSPVWSSRMSDNPDGGLDHMIAFRILGTSRADCRYVLAWEDIHGLGDRDYNDLVVEVSGVCPVPEPASLTLFGFGTLAVAGWRLRKRSGKA
jgi:hypothetical protein